MRELVNKVINKGIYNAPDLEVIPREAASNALGFVTTFKGVELARGRVRIGNLLTGSGRVLAEHFGYKPNGTAVHFRQIDTKVQFLSAGVWTDSITGLTTGVSGTFTSVTGLAGNFVFFFSRDGIWKIPVANPLSPVDMYDAAKNFKGKAIFDVGRHYMWDIEKDQTGLYLSYIDKATYTTVSNESIGTGDGVTKTFNATLAFKAGGATRTCFAIAADDGGVETFIDKLDGSLEGSLGGVGTINYATGAISITFNTAPLALADIQVDYQWENSNNGGVTDFTHSATRTAGQGDVLRQDEGGDAIQVVHPLESSHFSFKRQRIYRLTLDAADSTGDNRVFRSGVGIPSHGASTPTSSGIVFLNTFNVDNPELHVLERNPLGDNFNTRNLTPQFDYSDYLWDECGMTSFGDYVVFSGKTLNSTKNNRLFLVNLKLDSVDILPYEANTFAKDAGFLYAGDSLSNNTYQILSGFDDDGQPITGNWDSNEENYDTEQLKRARKVRAKGLIVPDQSYDIEISYDGGAYQNVGTIEGTGSYVDSGNPVLIGSNMVGQKTVGGEGEQVTVYPYLHEFKVNTPKFRKRTLRVVPQGVGYMSIEMLHDLDILLYDQKLPQKYR
jgi:hypothetical protein